MPFWQKVKGIFKREETPREKIARLSAERAGLVVQRERAYEEMAAVEKKEAELTADFADATPLTQRRIATEISQLRKAIERRQQVLATIDKKINIVDTGIHTLEMEQHLNPAKLAALEAAAQGSELVETGMATLDQLDEQAGATSLTGAEMSEGARDVLEELRAKFAEPPAAGEESGAAEAGEGPAEPAERRPAPAESAASPRVRPERAEPAARAASPEDDRPARAADRRRGEAEAG